MLFEGSFDDIIQPLRELPSEMDQMRQQGGSLETWNNI